LSKAKRRSVEHDAECDSLDCYQGTVTFHQTSGFRALTPETAHYLASHVPLWRYLSILWPISLIEAIAEILDPVNPKSAGMLDLPAPTNFS
jgi:hypothetical protein